MKLRNLIPVAALLCSNCMLLSGACIYEIRSLTVNGHVDQNGSELATAHLTLSEQRDSEPGKDLYWFVGSPTLKGHVTSATLRNSADPTTTLLTLDLAPADRPSITENAVSDHSGAPLGGLWDILGANHGVIQLSTDLPSQSVVEIPLTVTFKQNWTRPNCS